MATYEVDGVLKYKDSNNDINEIYPVTKLENLIGTELKLENLNLFGGNISGYVKLIPGALVLRDKELVNSKTLQAQLVIYNNENVGDPHLNLKDATRGDTYYFLDRIKYNNWEYTFPQKNGALVLDSGNNVFSGTNIFMSTPGGPQTTITGGTVITHENPSNGSKVTITPDGFLAYTKSSSTYTAYVDEKIVCHGITYNFPTNKTVATQTISTLEDLPNLVLYPDKSNTVKVKNLTFILEGDVLTIRATA